MKSRIALLVLWACFGLSRPALAAGALSEEAQKHFDAGVAYVDDPGGSKWDEGLKEFRAAYAASPTWKLLNNIGLCALNLERDGEAIEAYKEYLSRAGEKGISPKLKKQIEKDVAMLSASLVHVTIDVEPTDAILIDERRNAKGELVINQYPAKSGRAELGIHPGLHKVTVQAPGYTSAEWTFNAEPSSTHTHQFKLASETRTEAAPPTPPAAPAGSAAVAPPAVQPAQPKKTYTAVYVGLAATGVFAAAATTTGIITLNKEKSFDNASTPAEEDKFKKSGETFALLTDIGIGAAVLSAGATAYFYFSGPKDAPRDTGKARILWSPLATTHTAGLAVSGNF